MKHSLKEEDIQLPVCRMLDPGADHDLDLQTRLQNPISALVPAERKGKELANSVEVVEAHVRVIQGVHFQIPKKIIKIVEFGENKLLELAGILLLSERHRIIVGIEWMTMMRMRVRDEAEGDTCCCDYYCLAFVLVSIGGSVAVRDEVDRVD